ncbi:MAG: metallophosphoesterase [Desulfurococcales archaeon]|jgi:putative phosphoesterase|nr:metallophosphoesterase [Desulfurococcales archaeon]
MLIGVMSDTHDNLLKIDSAVKAFIDAGVGMVIHLGDYIAPFSLARILRSGIRFVGILGNNDGERLGLKEIASRSGQELHDPPHEIIISGKRILLLHGFGPKDRTVGIVEKIAKGGGYDAILYGHTHEIDIRIEGGTLILNPGEVFGGLSGRSTVALLDLSKMEARIINI